jgi:hypothetical protein
MFRRFLVSGRVISAMNSRVAINSVGKNLSRSIRGFAAAIKGNSSAADRFRIYVWIPLGQRLKKKFDTSGKSPAHCHRRNK